MSTYKFCFLTSFKYLYKINNSNISYLKNKISLYILNKMSRFIEFWEGYDIPVSGTYIHNLDYIGEYLGTEDVVLKGKYLFSSQKLKFSGKVKFNTGTSGALQTSGDYSLEHKPWNDSRYMFMHKSSASETTLDGHFWLARNNNLNFQLYTRNSVTQSNEGPVNNTKLHFRTLHQNFIVSVNL